MSTERERDAGPNWENRTLFHGDNLNFLRSLNSNTVDLIATDPPFNKNKDFHATPESLAKGATFKDRWRWDEDIHEEWVDQVQDDWEASWAVIESARHAFGTDMAAFLCWLGVRLMEMHRILKDDGSIYLHIDHTAHAYVKALMDSIFGSSNFQNEIVWSYGLGGSSKRRWSRKHDTILFYTKSEDYYFNKPTQPATSNKMKGKDKGMTDVWDIPTINNMAKERTGYPTQKPLALYELMVLASSQIKDIVFDPFCGCATTLVAAERHQRQWVGMDIWAGAHETVLSRLAQEGLAVEQGSSNPNRLMTFGEVVLRTDVPSRTDENETAAPKLTLPTTIADEPWQKLTNKVIRGLLANSQSTIDGFVDCAGCGRSKELPFMELDHIQPRSEGGVNFITNRVLLCGPCNQKKSDGFTLTGLTKQNNRDGWMQNITRARDAKSNAMSTGMEVKDDWYEDHVQEMVRRAAVGTLR